jgi:hypothetical protein
MKNVDLEKRIYKRENAELKQILKQEAEVVNYDYQPSASAYEPNYNHADFAPLVNPMPADDSTLKELTEEEIAAQRAYEATIEPPAPINVFQDPKMNDAFIMLNPERRAKILQMDRETRYIVMKGIMYKNEQQKEQQKEQQIPLVQPIPAEVSPDYPAYTPYDPNSPNYSPSHNPYIYNPPNGGSVNLFPGEPNMNAAFNMLNGEKQARILQMEPELRKIVMKQIMLKNGKQTNTVQTNNIQPQSGGGELEHYFNTLPANKKLEALKGAYNSMSTDFSKLAGKVSNPLTRIVKPVSMQEQLTDSLPLLAVETKDKIYTATDTNTEKSVSFSSDSSSSSSSNSSSGGSTKKITIN